MDFIHRIASFSPVPAGGAAVANSFCLAIALIYKVVLFESERNYHNPEMNQNLMAAKKDIERLLRDAERLVDEDRQAGLNERPGALYVLVADVRGDTDGVHFADHVLRLCDDVRDERSFRDAARIRGVVRPDVRDLDTRNPDVLGRLFAEVVRDHGIRALRHGRPVVPVDDGAGEGSVWARGGAKQGETQWFR